MIKLKDLLSEGPSFAHTGPNELRNLRIIIIQAMGNSLDLGNQGYQMTLITNHLAAANKALDALQRKSK